MNDTLSSNETTSTAKREYPLDWRKKMSDHVAWALIVYTGLHIFATMSAMKATGMKAFALLALIILVVGIIPSCRKFEKSWREISDEQASDVAYEGAFKRDLTMLWGLALGLPFVLTAIFRGIAALF